MPPAERQPEDDEDEDYIPEWDEQAWAEAEANARLAYELEGS